MSSCSASSSVSAEDLGLFDLLTSPLWLRFSAFARTSTIVALPLACIRADLRIHTRKKSERGSGIGLAKALCMPGASATTNASKLARPTFDEVYADNFRLVWSGAKRLGIPSNTVEDIVQEVFVTVHRHLGALEGQQVKAWLFSILIRVVWNYRRTRQRKGAGQALACTVEDPDSIMASGGSPLDKLLQREAAALLQQVLDNLGEARAALFVMSEVEGMTAPEISSITAANLSTVYGRLRAMRTEFDRQVQLLTQELEVA